MTIEQSESAEAPGGSSTAALAELQAVCQRILASEAGNVPPTLIATANGAAVAGSLEALRRQCVDNHQQVDELKRSIDGLRGVVAADSAGNGNMLLELRRAVDTMTEVVDGENRRMGELVGAVEALRVGLTGSGASARQQFSDLRATVESLERSVGALGGQVENALASLGGQISAAFSTMAGQIQDAFNAFGQQVGMQMGHQSEAFDGLHQALLVQRTQERLDELEALLSVGLPKFGEEIQASVQQTMLSVSRTFRLAEREHGNRMAELHRDFAATARRLEAAMTPRRRETETIAGGNQAV